MGGSSAFIPLYLGQGTPRYNEEVKLVQDKFFDIVNRMDFSTQEKIYYRLALVEKDKKNWNEAVSLLKQAQERTSTAERGVDMISNWLKCINSWVKAQRWTACVLKC